jgi:hypothetical protein
MASNAEIYLFSDFTRENYSKLIRLAKETYTFRLYMDFKHEERFVIWRHDVDISAHSARKLAQIEAQEEVSCTYFLLLHSEFYNLLEKEITDYVLEIIDLGHSIGLHFDTNYYGISDQSELEYWLRFEVKILEEIFGENISTFSFHNTTPFTQNCREWQYAGLINTYADYFQSNVGYCSDSNGYWRFRRLEDVLRDAQDECLQVLTHPEWWQDIVMSPKQKIYHCIEHRAIANKEWYEQILREFGRDNIDQE